MLPVSDETIDAKIAVTSTLADGSVVAFDIPHSEADDHDETHLAYELLQAAAGK